MEGCEMFLHKVALFIPIALILWWLSKEFHLPLYIDVIRSLINWR